MYDFMERNGPYELSKDLLNEYRNLFKEHNIPISESISGEKADKIIMVSTHGYWGDPPPAGVPDTGGQTYYVLESSKAWAELGRKVIILARWFHPFPKIEKFAENLWLVRIKAGGNQFIRKEDIYRLLPEMAEAATAISVLFGANAVMGHYADGMAVALEIGERLGIPVVNIPHSMGVRKLERLGFDPKDPESWLDPQYNFWTRESYEISSLKGANFEIANTPAEPEILKRYYDYEFPHLIMPAGAGKDYFNVFQDKSTPEILNKYNLQKNKYLIFFGRFSEAKNIPGVVKVYGELVKLNPENYKDIKLAVVGGDPEQPMEEERIVEKQILKIMTDYDLNKDNVVRVPSQQWDVLSLFTHNSLFYVGMQIMEPFGMSAAEAMASGAPVMISKLAGITRWLKDGEQALIVDPEKPEEAARRLNDTINNKEKIYALIESGYKLAKAKFSWLGIAKELGGLLDDLCQDRSPNTMNNDRDFTEIFKRREGRAFHRAAFAWRGDPPIIKDKHKKAAKGLMPYIVNKVKEAGKQDKRVVVAIGGESGAGKTEIAEYLRFLLRSDNIWATTIPGDAFFKLQPSDNHQARLNAYEEGRLKDYLGPNEVDIERLDAVLASALDKNCELVEIPSDCRSLKKRYENVPINLHRTDVAVVDLTYSLLLKNADLKIFLESDFSKRIDEVKERNMARDPDQDFDFILKVLEIEHSIIQELRKEADFFVTKEYDIKKA